MTPHSCRSCFYVFSEASEGDECNSVRTSHGVIFGDRALFLSILFLWGWENVISGVVLLKIVVHGHGEGTQVCS